MEHLLEKLKWFGQIVERLADEIRRLRAELADKTQQHDELNEKHDELNEKYARLRDEKLELSDEVRHLKNLPRRPKIKPSKPSKLHPKPKSDTVPVGKRKPRQYSDKAERKTIIVEAPDVPEGSRRDGYKSYTIQDLILCPVVIEYRRECWRTPSGERIVAPVPQHVHGQYGANLLRMVASLYYQAQSTQPRIVSLLKDWGISISKRTVVRMLTDGFSELVEESQQVLEAGIRGAKWLHVDDTGARHRHKSGYCTVIGNDQFTYFASRKYKTRLNFLLLLSGPKPSYVLNEAAFEYMSKRKLAKRTQQLLRAEKQQHFESETKWKAHLQKLGIVKQKAVTYATEAALWGSLSEPLDNTVILSDDAGQFKVGLHALCWIHAERHLPKLHASGERNRQAVESKRDEIWKFYRQLLDYCRRPDPKVKQSLFQHFDDIFDESTCYTSLNLLLQGLADNKSELLRALDFPCIPLHNNLGENDVRAHVTRRKISAGTRSESGRDARCRPRTAENLLQAEHQLLGLPRPSIQGAGRPRYTTLGHARPPTRINQQPAAITAAGFVFEGRSLIANGSK